mmetsp:Transcript_9151/g.11332  ORF Transcript_9151/g.11332 Transcript_9151/m.11332 type:complete len:188 (+) Transcript_9151:146-709(+)
MRARKETDTDLAFSADAPVSLPVLPQHKTDKIAYSSRSNWKGALLMLVVWFFVVWCIGTFFHQPHVDNFELRKLTKRFPHILDPIEVPFKFGLSNKDQINHNDEQFQCRDGSAIFPLDMFNDDYCDCRDGSDEPGTAACSHLVSSKFFCYNNGNSRRIPSSFVNDGVCDCCDGTDEWLDAIHCINTC